MLRLKRLRRFGVLNHGLVDFGVQLLDISAPGVEAGDLVPDPRENLLLGLDLGLGEVALRQGDLAIADLLLNVGQ